MADGILGLGSSGAASLNQDLIDKLKAAERKATVEPIETDIENITSDIETFDTVDQAVKDVIEAIRPFDWFKTDGVNAFEEKSASTTGSSVIFDATDVTSLNEGTTTVEVTQIGQKDVFQSKSITNDITSNISDFNFTIDTVSVTSGESDFASLATAINGTSLSASYDSADKTFTINSTTIDLTNGTTDTTDDITDYKDLIKAFTSEGTIAFSENISTFSFTQASNPSYQSDIFIKSSDLVGSSGTVSITTGTGADAVTVDFTVDANTTYADLVSDIKANSNFTAEITSSGRLSIASADGSTDLSFSGSIDLETTLGMSKEIKIATNGLSYEEFADRINEVDGVTAAINEVSTNTFRLVVKSNEVGTENALSFNTTDNNDATSIASELGLINDAYTATVADSTKIHTTSSANLVITVDTTDYTIDIANKTYDEIVDSINNLKDASGYSVDVTAAIIDGKLQIQDTNGSSISINDTSSAFLSVSAYENSLENNVLKAQSMKMTVDGVDYEAAANEIVVDGLTIKATTEGTSTITVENDTSYLATQMQTFVDAYNTLVDVVGEAAAVDSDMYNKSGLKSILDQIKERVMDYYGPEGDQTSLFSIGFGFNDDKSGKLTFDETVFSEVATNDLDSLKDMFIGSSYYSETNPGGFGTQLKSLIDNMYYSSGAVNLFETSLDDREETLNTELEKAENTLNTKYDQLLAQFAAYSTIITQMEASFGGLKMMIEQSTASN